MCILLRQAPSERMHGSRAGRTSPTEVGAYAPLAFSYRFMWGKEGALGFSPSLGVREETQGILAALFNPKTKLRSVLPGKHAGHVLILSQGEWGSEPQTQWLCSVLGAYMPMTMGKSPNYSVPQFFPL